jgi:hypothetical protein
MSGPFNVETPEAPGGGSSALPITHVTRGRAQGRVSVPPYGFGISGGGGAA